MGPESEAAASTPGSDGRASVATTTYCGRTWSTLHLPQVCTKKKCPAPGVMQLEKHFGRLGWACAGCLSFAPLSTGERVSTLPGQ